MRRVPVHLTLHRNAEQWGYASADLDLDGQGCVALTPMRHAADYIRVVTVPMDAPDPHAGWASIRAVIDYNGQTLGDGSGYQPLTFYTAEPTDWNTGLARYADMHGWPDAHDRALRAPAVWTLGVRIR